MANRSLRCARLSPTTMLCWDRFTTSKEFSSSAAMMSKSTSTALAGGGRGGVELAGVVVLRNTISVGMATSDSMSDQTEPNPNQTPELDPLLQNSECAVFLVKGQMVKRREQKDSNLLLLRRKFISCASQYQLVSLFFFIPTLLLYKAYTLYMDYSNLFILVLSVFFSNL